jgi:hypothetical protein
MSSDKDLARKDLKRFSALESVRNSEGGILLVASLKKDINSSLQEIAAKYKMLSHAELIGACAQLSERLSVYNVLLKASSNKKMVLKDLEELLAEDPDED